MDDELKAVLNRLARGQEETTVGVVTLAEQLLNLAKDVDVVRSAVQGVEQRLTHGQTELRTVMMERFERVEDKLTRMSEDIQVNIMATSTASAAGSPIARRSPN